MTNDRFDVLVVGAGAAGLYAALCIPEHLQVGLINKDSLPISASDWAQGGIAAAIAADDSPQLHVADTLVAGAGLCDPAAVQFLAEQAPACVASLVKLGVTFDQVSPGPQAQQAGVQLALTLEAAHSRRRVLHSADTTGRAVVSTLAAQVLERKNIQFLSPAFVVNLWLNAQTHRCQGVSLIYRGQLEWVTASAIVLATGGGGQVFAQTTNPEVSTGDGVAMAWRAGALLRDLEFFQFHPTALTKTDAPRFLISEAVRGEGAHLVDHRGHRFTFDYHPAGELAPRDVVSRAIFQHLQITGEPTVWLDLRPIPAERIHHRFPNIIQVCRRWGIDVLTEPIPVAPAAHYWMGGIVADQFNQTSIPGLYAVGETASTGVHGANRLASNSLLECIVYGAQMQHLQANLDQCSAPEPAPNLTPQSFSLDPSELAQVEVWRQELPSLMWRSAGISREEKILTEAIAQVEVWREQFSRLGLTRYLINLPAGQSITFSSPDSGRILRTWGETYNLLDVAYLMLRSAAFRTESRGGHYRLDYPQPLPDWQVHTLIHRESWYSSPCLPA